MKKFSLKALGASLLTLGLVVAGAAVPAQAAPLTAGSVTSSGAVSGSTNPNPITISMTTATAGQSLSVMVVFPTGWSWVTPNPSTSPAAGCSSWSGSNQWVASVTNFTPTLQCEQNTSIPFPNNARLFLNSFSQSAVPLASGVQVQLVIPANSVNVGQGTDFVLRFGDGSGAAVDESTVALGANPAPAPAPAPAPVVDPTLANTGFDGAPYLAGGLSLALVGGSLILIARRKVTS